MDEMNPTVDDAKLEMDEGIAGVMPDSWEGHGRIVIRRSDLSYDERALAVRSFRKMRRKHDDVSPEKLAEVIVDKVKDRR